MLLLGCQKLTQKVAEELVLRPTYKEEFNHLTYEDYKEAEKKDDEILKPEVLPQLALTR